MKFIKAVNTEMNRAVIGEVYKIDGVHKTVTRITKESVYLEDKPYDKVMFNSLARQAKKLKKDIRSLQPVEKSEPESLLQSFPSYELRFIIIEREDEVYKLVFAQRHSSHAEMLDEYRRVHGKNHYPAGGGFYTRLAANANNNIMGGNHYGSGYNSTVILYGRSDSFGLNPDKLKLAMENCSWDCIYLGEITDKCYTPEAM